MTSTPDLRRRRSLHVVMLLNNSCVNDSRVIKSAEALVDGGFMVTVLCRQDKNLPQVDEINGVVYQRLAPQPKNFESLYSRLRASWSDNHRVGHPQSFAGTRSSTSVRSVGILTSLLDWFQAFTLPIVKRLIRAFTPPIVKRLIRAVARRVVRSWRKLLTALSYPARVLYRHLETEEYTSIVYSHAVQLRPDVVHCHDLATLPAGVAISKKCACKLVYDSHELEMHRNAKYTKANQRKRRKNERAGITRADAVITVSDSIADHLRDDYRIRRPHVVMNAPDFDEHEHSIRTVRDDLCLSSDTPLAVYVGSVTINRGLEYVVKALKLYPELHFATVGPRRPATQAELYDLAVELQVLDRLHFVDPVPPKAVVGYIATCDVSVLPIQNVCLSYYYCMPNKLLESVFANIPVAVADLLEMRRFVEAFRCGLVMDEKSPDSIANAIKSIVKDRAGFMVPIDLRQQINDTYTWKVQEGKLLSLYEGLFAAKEIRSEETS